MNSFGMMSLEPPSFRHFSPKIFDQYTDEGLQKMIDRANEYILPSVDKRGIEVLPIDFVPGAYSVICQRGKECYDHGKTLHLLCTK